MEEYTLEEKLQDIADIEEFRSYLSNLIDREVESGASVKCTNFLYSILLSVRAELDARIEELGLVRLEGECNG